MVKQVPHAAHYIQASLKIGTIQFQHTNFQICIFERKPLDLHNLILDILQGLKNHACSTNG
jgi:hypothetical protein